MLQPQRRGFAFQQFLVRLFSLHNLDPRGAFRLTGEEIDGSFELEGNIYLLEAKWQALPCGQKELLAFQGKVEGKAAWVRGLVISYSGFSEQGLAAFANGRRTSIIGMDGRDLAAILEDRTNLVDAIKWKLRRSAETNAFFVSLEDEG